MSVILGTMTSVLDAGHRVSYLGGQERAVKMVKLANRLKVSRAERGLTQAELACLAGVTRQTISSIENAEFVPSALLAFVLAKCLAMPVEALFILEGDES